MLGIRIDRPASCHRGLSRETNALFMMHRYKCKEGGSEHRGQRTSSDRSGKWGSGKSSKNGGIYSGL